MKHILITLFFFLSSTMMAQTTTAAKNDTDAVTLESYEQGWLDHEGTLSLKNNTDEDIYNVVFVIKYLDMNGKQLDYKEYKSDVNIAPGLSKKIDIPAYEHERNYSYYKSEAKTTSPHKFKIEYELKDYNIEEDDGQYAELDDDFGVGAGHSMAAVGIALAVCLFVIGISIGLYVLVAVMAQKRNRSAVIWLLLSFIATPLLI